MSATPPADWTSGPAKRLAVFILGAAVIAGLGHSYLRGSTARRADTVAPVGLTFADAAPGIAPAGETAASGSAQTAPVQPSGPAIAVRINLNRASRSELELLPGIGPALAQRIADERAKAPFARIEDLSRVRGIGAKTIDRLRNHVTIE